MNLRRTLQFPDTQIVHLAFSREGSPMRQHEKLYLAAAGSPKIGVYDLNGGDMPFFMYEVHQGPVTCVGFEPEKSEFLYSSSEDGTLRVFVLADHNGGPQAHHDEIIQQASANSWRQPTSRATIRTFFNSDGSKLIGINDVVYYAPEMYYFTVDNIGRLRIWRHVKTDDEDGLRSEFRPGDNSRQLQCIDMASDYSTVVMANLDGFVFIYRTHDLLHSPEPVPGVIRPTTSYVPRVRLSKDVQLLACPMAVDGIKIFRMRDIIMSGDQQGTKGTVQTVAPAQHFIDRPGWIWDVSFIGDSVDYLIGCSSNTRTMLWNLSEMSQSVEFPHSRKAVICLSVKELVFDPEQPFNPNVAAGYNHGMAGPGPALQPPPQGG